MGKGWFITWEVSLVVDRDYKSLCWASQNSTFQLVLSHGLWRTQWVKDSCSFIHPECSGSTLASWLSGNSHLWYKPGCREEDSGWEGHFPKLHTQAIILYPWPRGITPFQCVGRPGLVLLFLFQRSANSSGASAHLDWGSMAVTSFLSVEMAEGSMNSPQVN